MASPVNDSYSCASGGTIYAGRYNWPAWRQAIAANTWAQVGSNTLSVLNPDNDVLINPSYPSSGPWHGSTGFTGIVTAWNGACWDETTGTFWFPLQGGHADWGGNEPYKICLKDASPTFSMLRYPSGAVGNTITLNDGQEATGLYSDGRLRPGHSYNNNIYVPGYGPLICRVKGPFISGATDYGKVYLLNESTGESTLVVDLTSLSPGQSYGGAAYDASRNKVLTTGVGNTPLVAINMTTSVATVAVTSDNYIGQYAKLVVLPEHDLLMFIHNGGGGYPAQIYMRELSALGTLITPTLSGSASAGLSLNGQVGAAWDSVNGRLLLWNNATSRTEISTLTPGANPRTDTWTWGTLSVSGSNTETPTAAAGNGTYGRFGYSESLGGCFLLNAVSQKIYFFATR